jgi:hypothetical protein
VLSCTDDGVVDRFTDDSRCSSGYVRQCQDLYLPSAQIVPVIRGWFCGMDHESPVPPAPISRGDAAVVPRAFRRQFGQRMQTG